MPANYELNIDHDVIEVSAWDNVGLGDIEEYQEKIDEAVKSAESGKGFSGNAGSLKQSSAKELSEEMLREDVMILVSYSADWYEPCRQMRSELERLAWKHGDKVVVLDIHIDDEQALAAKEGVETIPDFRLMYAGKELDRAKGNLPFSVLETMVMQNAPVLEGSSSRALIMPDGGVIEPANNKYLPEGFSKKRPTGKPKPKAKK